ncbi:MAG: hypothetical protein IH933_16685 [Euryarchaeota archaeon]|nr:hypothetical protein [Euryarchaeota archaeon]
MTEKYRFDLLTDTRTCYRYLQAGLGVIVLTTLIGLVVLVFPELLPVYDVLVMPALFVGLGLLLFGVGTHLHIMHLNVVRMMDEDQE